MVTMDALDVDRIYSSETAIAVTGMTYRQLDYFMRTIRTGTGATPGSGRVRHFELHDLLLMAAQRHLLDLGLSQQQAWAALSEGHGLDLSAAVSLNINWRAISDEVIAKLDARRGA